MSLLGELKRRNVLRVGAAYVVVAWLVIQVVETILPAFGFGEGAVRVVTIGFAVGFIPTLIFAWAFELTPEGLKKESEVDRSQSITPTTGKKLDRMIMLALGLGLAYFAFDKFVLTPQREAKQFAALQADKTAEVEQARQQGRTEALVESYGDKSIAVLPFVNISDDAGNEFFSDGISEELLNLLAKIPELRVISRSSAFSFKGKDLGLPEIADRLNVAHILEGSVRKSGDQVRITAQLIEAHSDTHLWSETYDRRLDDVFAIQDDIAAMVVEQLKIKLLDAVPKAQETNPEAYAIYLQARYLDRQFTAVGLEQSNALFEQALALDPNYAAAWDGLAANYATQASYGLLPQDEGFILAREAAEKALAIDPDYARAHGSLGWISMWYDNDLSAAASHYERALELDPSDPDILRDSARLLSALGRQQQAIKLNEYVSARDPVNGVNHANLGFAYLIAGRWDEAIASYETVLRLVPDRIAAHCNIGTAFLFKGKAEEALVEFGQEVDVEFRIKGQAMALYDLGRQAEFEIKVQELIERWGDDWPSEVAHVYAYIGDADTAFRWLEKSVAEEPGAFGPQYPFLQSLRTDPRWLPLLKQMGKSAEQLDAIPFEVNLP